MEDEKETSQVVATTSEDAFKYDQGKVTLNELREKHGLKKITSKHANYFVKKVQ